MLSERVFLCAADDRSGTNHQPAAQGNNSEPSEEAKVSPVVLTRREGEVARLTLKGLTAKEIAHELSLSPRTIEDYLQKVKMKLSCRSKLELVAKLVNYYKK